MPNHCYNRARFYFDDEDEGKKIKELLITEDKEDPVNSNYFDLNKIVPQPKAIDPNIQCKHDYEPNTGWYDWRIDNWGTKWNTYDHEVLDESEDTYEVEFSTAWAPPEVAIHYLRRWMVDNKLTASLSFFYDEPGMEFAGYLKEEDTTEFFASGGVVNPYKEHPLRNECPFKEETPDLWCEKHGYECLWDKIEKSLDPELTNKLSDKAKQRLLEKKLLPDTNSNWAHVP